MTTVLPHFNVLEKHSNVIGYVTFMTQCKLLWIIIRFFLASSLVNSIILHFICLFTSSSVEGLKMSSPNCQYGEFGVDTVLFVQI